MKKYDGGWVEEDERNDTYLAGTENHNSTKSVFAVTKYLPTIYFCVRVLITVACQAKRIVHKTWFYGFSI